MNVVAQGKDPDEARVGDVMHGKPTVLQEDASLLDAAQMFARTGVRRLPVVDRHGELAGIIAIDDLMILLGNEMGHVAAARAAGLCRPGTRSIGAA